MAQVIANETAAAAPTATPIKRYRTFLDNHIDLDYVTTHVVLPSKITKDACSNYSENTDTESVFITLLSAVLLNAEFGELVPNTCRSITLWKSYLSSIRGSHQKYDNSQEISQAIRNIQIGDVLPFYFKTSNMAFLISKPNSVLDDILLISWFQVAADAPTINSTHKLLANYPEYSFQVPFSEFAKSESFADKIVALVNDSTHSYKLSSSLAAGNVEWVTMTLMGPADPILNISEDIIPIQKSIKDEALSTDFRRSGLWATMKVALQLGLVEELGEVSGKLYKLIMIKLLCQIIKEHNQTSDMALMMELLTKLAGKIEKLKTRFMSVDTGLKFQEI